jgi:hypothetical protein
MSRELGDDMGRRGGVNLSLSRGVPLAFYGLVLVALVAGCAGSASGSSSPSAGGSSLTDAAAKEAVLAQFGPLVYCDPDFYPIARVDEMVAATEHLAEMRANTTTWAAIAAHQGFDPSAAPSGNSLLAAYREWKMLRGLALVTTGSGWTFDARFGGIGPEASASPVITRVVGAIAADGAIRVELQEPSGAPPCPICLARGTLIATPRGDVPIEALETDDPVWTLDRAGRRVSAIVDQIGSMAVPPAHEVVRLVLADGRAVLASPGHPLVDGRPVAILGPGDDYDGSMVVSARRIAYQGGRTFDIRPSGQTGAYWANGIELGSTLSR